MTVLGHQRRDVPATTEPRPDQAAAPGPVPEPVDPGYVRRTSLRTRITALVTIAVGVAVALASVAAYLTARNALHQRLDDNLRQRAGTAVQTSLPVLLNSPLADNRSQQAMVGALLALGSDLRIAIVFADGSHGATAKPPPLTTQVTETAVRVADGGSARLVTAQTGGVSYRLAIVPVPPNRALGQPSAFVLAQSTSDIDSELRRIALVMALVGAAGILVAALAGTSIARGGLRPVEQLTVATEHVAATEDLRPIPVSGTDELARLTASFNKMLHALGLSRERQRQLIADASHELRTPLTSLRTNIELLSQIDATEGATISPADRAELLDDVRAQIGELTALVGDLVELAKSDRPLDARAEPVDLAEPVTRALERVRRRAPGVRFEVTLATWPVLGDPASLERAAANLLDNAAKWSPPGGTVTVALSDGVLEVSDQGPGIDDADLPHVFERFYRASDARGLPGSGLGLAIVRQAAERHGGSVYPARGRNGGTVMTMRIPGLAAADSRVPNSAHPGLGRP